MRSELCSTDKLALRGTQIVNKEQLSLAVRFADIDGTIHEEFLGFISLERITGEAIASAILDVLPKWNLNIKNCRGQGYDGASNMSSVRRGTQALLLEECPLAVYTHCRTIVSIWLLFTPVTNPSLGIC